MSFGYVMLQMIISNYMLYLEIKKSHKFDNVKGEKGYWI